MKSANEFRELEREWYKRLKDSGFRDIENKYNQRLDPGPLRYSNFHGNLFENRLENQSYFRVIGLYIHHCKNVKERHKKVLERYIESGNIPTAIEEAKVDMKPKTMWTYLTRNFNKMLEFVNKLDKEAQDD